MEIIDTPYYCVFVFIDVEDGALDVQWTSAQRRPKRSGDFELWIQMTLPLLKKRPRRL